LFQLAGSAESGSEHPIARAIIDKSKELNCILQVPKTFRILPGKGVRSIINGHTVLVGNLALMKSIGITKFYKSNKIQKLSHKGKTVVYMAVDRKLTAIFGISNSIKPEAYNVVACLKQQHIKVWMITGDNKKTALSIANSLGIDNVIAEVLPNSKATQIASLQASGEVVLMVGDGINDGPALAKADIGVAVGTAADLTMAIADIILIRDDLNALLLAMQLARRVYRRICINLGWAFLYNIVTIPIAAGIFWVPYKFYIPPPVAGLNELFSSIPVILFSLMLKF